jgi:hypothetical protein
LILRQRHGTSSVLKSSRAPYPTYAIGQEAEIVPEADPSRLAVGRVIRIAATFGTRKLKSDAANEASDERVVEVVVSADAAPVLIGQRVLVKFMKPGEKPGQAHAGANQRARVPR